MDSNKWQEEDNDDIKENWDDEDDEPSKSSSNTDSTQQQQPVQTEPKAKTTKKKNKALKEKILKREVEDRPKSAEELLAEKLERQRLVEEGDLALAKETFGISASSNPTVLDNIRLATKEDFDEFYKALDSKLSPYSRSPHYLTFVENLVRSLSAVLDTDDIKKLNSTLTTLYNEKIKLQKVCSLFYLYGKC